MEDRVKFERKTRPIPKLNLLKSLKNSNTNNKNWSIIDPAICSIILNFLLYFVTVKNNSIKFFTHRTFRLNFLERNIFFHFNFKLNFFYIKNILKIFECFDNFLKCLSTKIISLIILITRCNFP